MSKLAHLNKKKKSKHTNISGMTHIMDVMHESVLKASYPICLHNVDVAKVWTLKRSPRLRIALTQVLETPCPALLGVFTAPITPNPLNQLIKIPSVSWCGFVEAGKTLKCAGKNFSRTRFEKPLESGLGWVRKWELCKIFWGRVIFAIGSRL